MIDDTTRAKAVGMYASGMPSTHVAEDLGISDQSVIRWVKAAGVKVRPRSTHGDYTKLSDTDAALTGGRWVRSGLLWHWQPFIAPSKRGMSDRERRIEWEEAMFDAEQLRDLHARYVGGCREPRTVVGERVYQRHSKRARRAA